MGSYRLVLLLLAVFVTSTVNGQGSNVPKSFAQRNYIGCLQNCQPLIDSIIKSPATTFDQLTIIAISLEKTVSWDSANGWRIGDVLKGSPVASRYLDGLKLLLSGDVDGLPRLFDGREPEVIALMQASVILREYGFELAANAIGVFTDDLAEKRIQYILSIPKDRHEMVINLLLKHLASLPAKSKLAQSALNLLLHPSSDITVDQEECYKLLLTLGKGTTLISFDTAKQLFHAGRKKEASAMVTRLAAESSTDLIVQLCAIHFLKTIGDSTGSVALYQKALSTVPEPMRRNIRLDYLEYLQLQKQQEEVINIQKGKDLLFAGDAFLISAQYENAVTQYLTVLNDHQSPLETRVAAWSGLLESDPSKALDIGLPLFNELTNSTLATRGPMLVWTGRQLWQVTNREMKTKSSKSGELQSYRPIHDVEGWENRASGLLDILIKTDPTACLRPDLQYNPNSLRYPAAVLFALSGNPDNAVEILNREVNYELQSDKPFNSVSTNIADKLRMRTTPTLSEKKLMTMLLMDVLSRCPKADERVPSLSVVIANDIAYQLVKDTKDADIRTHLQELASLVRFTAVALDPLQRPLRTDQQPPPTHKVDMTRFAPIDAVVRKALTSDTVAKQSLLLVNEGLRDALLTASNPELLTALTELSSYTIQRYAEVCKQPCYAVDERKRLADYLISRPVYDMKPYVTRLIEGVAK